MRKPIISFNIITGRSGMLMFEHYLNIEAYNFNPKKIKISEFSIRRDNVKYWTVGDRIFSLRHDMDYDVYNRNTQHEYTVPRDLVLRFISGKEGKTAYAAKVDVKIKYNRFADLEHNHVYYGTDGNLKTLSEYG